MTELMGEISRRDLLTVTAGMALIAGIRCDAQNVVQSVPHLFAPGDGELREITKRASGRVLDTSDIQRNSAGSRVYMIASGEVAEQRKILVISTNEAATILTPPAYIWALADDLTFVAWADDLKTGVHFRTGYAHKELSQFATIGFAPGAKYYFIAKADYTTIVYATEAPGVPLATVNIRGRRIFDKGDQVYLFGAGGPSYLKTGEEKEILGKRFQIIDGRLNAGVEILVPRPRAAPSPFAVVDLDMFSNRLLCIDIRDRLGAEWFSYDIDSHLLTDIGPSHKHGLFLSNELIKLLR